jgi:hypothetical protein
LIKKLNYFFFEKFLSGFFFDKELTDFLFLNFDFDGDPDLESLSLKDLFFLLFLELKILFLSLFFLKKEVDVSLSFSIVSSSSPDVSSQSSRLSNRKNNKDFRLDKSSNYKKRKRVDEDTIEKDNETSTSFFKKKRLTNKIFNSRNNKKNRSFKLNDSRSGSPSKSKFKKRKSVNSLSKKKPDKNFSKKK